MFSLSSSTSSRRWVPSNQAEWVEEILEGLAEGPHAVDMPTSIFNVTEGVREIRPLAYTPQAIALGPYHHWKPQLYEMEKYKIFTARRVQQRLPSRRLKDVEKQFRKRASEIRAYYNRFCRGARQLKIDNDTLSWMMVVDTCFLLDFLQMYKTTNQAQAVPLCMLHLYGIPGNRYSVNGDVLRDVIMIENQLPLFLLQILDAEVTLQTTATMSNPESTLEAILTTYMVGLTPFKSIAVVPRIDITTTPRAHLLDVLYHVLVPASPSPPATSIEEDSPIEYEGAATPAKETPPQSSCINQLLRHVYNTASIEPVRVVRRIVETVPCDLLRSLIPWWSSAEAKVKKVLGDEEGMPPKVEQILIPSVKELVGAGVRFQATDGGVSTIAFDPRTATFSLPSVTIDGTTEVVLRNLVAYESFSTCGPELVLGRYVELMNGIIDTEEDVVLLRQSGVVNNYMSSDAEVAEMWNGMSNSMRLTRVGYLDAAIRDVNAYYNGRWKVRARRGLSKYVYRFWRFLALVAALLLLLLNALQAVCSVYTCAGGIRFRLLAK